MKPMMKPSRTTRLLENEKLATRNTEHLASAGAATNRSEMRANDRG
jgi:hypothetical protein